jgi:hypothetical protein
MSLAPDTGSKDDSRCKRNQPHQRTFQGPPHVESAHPSLPTHFPPSLQEHELHRETRPFVGILTLKAELEVDREFDTLFYVGLENVEPSQKWSLVIARATTN